jgi:hypothetical protein
MARSARTLAVLFLAANAVGCAALAKTTPSPARQFTRADLEQVPRPDNERYYVLVFGSQAVPYLRPDLTHTWVTVVKATWPAGYGCGEPVLEQFSISWLPATLELRPFRFRIEPATNLTMDQTLAWAQGTGQRVSLWGPYELRTSVYRRAVIHREFLESGAVGYQVVDTVGEAARTGLGCDCIHAISDMDPDYERGWYPLIWYGIPASRRLVREAARREVFLDRDTTHDWLIPALGLDRYPIERRDQPYRGILPLVRVP